MAPLPAFAVAPCYCSLVAFNRAVSKLLLHCCIRQTDLWKKLGRGSVARPSGLPAQPPMLD